MKALFLLLVSFLGLIAAPAQAQSGQGLQISLVTGGYRFDVTTPAPAKSIAKTRAVPKKASFPANVLLRNLSHSSVPLTYPDAAAAAHGFRFRVLAEDGSVAWQSEADPAAGTDPVVTELRAKKVLRRTVEIPLKVGGAWLPTGRYTLEATAGLNGPAATSVFELTSPLDSGTGIRGRVFLQDGDGPEVPVSATVQISELKLLFPGGDQSEPFSWTGTTDAEGRFSVATPPGSYSINVTPLIEADPSVLSEPAVSAKPIEIVRVIEGQYSEYNYEIHSSLQSTKSLVPWVTSVSAYQNGFITNSFPTVYHPILEIRATGSVPTGGYVNPRLVPRVSNTLTSELLEFDFLIDPPAPGTMVTHSFVTHAATYYLPGVAGVPRVRVYGHYNSLDSPAKQF